MSRAARLAAAALLCAGPALAQRGNSDAIRPDALRAHLFVIAHDSMGGRDTGSRGNMLAAEYVAATFRRLGLEPAGDSGTFFQTVPFVQVVPDTTLKLTVGGRALTFGRDFIVNGRVNFAASGHTAVYGGVATDSSTWPAAGAVRGKIVVLSIPAGGDTRTMFAAIGPTRGNPRFAGAVAYAYTGMDAIAPDLLDQMMQARPTTNTAPIPAGIPILLITPSAFEALIGAPVASARTGQEGTAVSGGAGWTSGPLPYPARNVVAILRGSDPARRNTYVAVTAHNDHVGYTRRAIDHDSTRTFNQIVRPMGADSRMREPTAEEAARVRALRDSLRRVRPPRMDSIFNGADDDGSGTVALLEIARTLAAGRRPARSILFVNHAAEERGLLGSRWYADHTTVPRDSIIAEMDEDMIGRGNADDLPAGGPGYLEVIGARRLSTEYGDSLEAVNRRQAQPFTFDYTFDQPGHPLQYYCRADHFSYARWGIPAFAVSRGEHRDYHQVTDEAQYIDYTVLSRVATLIRDLARVVGNMPNRPVVDGVRQDPNQPCRQ